MTQAPQTKALALPPLSGPPALRIVSNQAFIPAGFWPRLAASVIDGIALTVAQTPIRIGLQLAVGQDSIFQMLNGFAGIILAVAYYTYFYENRGATPGKMVLGLRVIDRATGENPGATQTVKRELLGKFLSLVTLLGGYAMAVFRQDKRALHDLVANTQVVRDQRKTT